MADANILIDLHLGGILRRAFDLPFSWLTPDVVLAELHNPDSNQLLDYGLKVEVSVQSVYYKYS